MKHSARRRRNPSSEGFCTDRIGQDVRRCVGYAGRVASGGVLSSTVGDLFNGRSDDLALLVPDEQRSFTYGRLADDVASFAGMLAEAGVDAGDRVALVLPNGPELVGVLLAALALGAAAAPLNPAYTEEEHRFYLGDLEPRVLVVPEGEHAGARAARPEGTVVIELGSGTGKGGTGPTAGDPEAMALLLHTSGTTSRPKLVPLLHRNLVAAARSISAFYGLAASDTSYCAMPLFHVHGLVASVLAPLAAGGAVVVPARLSGARFWRQLDEHGVTWYSAAPAVHRMLLDRLPADGGGTSLRFARSCSAPLAPALMTELEARLGIPVLEAYGMTEACHQISSNPLPPAERRPGWVGVPAGADIRVVDERGADALDGSVGEVVVRGSGVMPRYLGDPGDGSFLDGWFRTGDLGALENGWLRLCGRLKEIIIRGGENVSPYEVEAALLVHPAVAEAVCFGVPNDRYGEEVAAAVVLKGQATPEDLAAHCRDRLAAFKVPRMIAIVAAIPLTATGKLQRRRIASLLGLA